MLSSSIMWSHGGHRALRGHDAFLINVVTYCLAQFCVVLLSPHCCSSVVETMIGPCWLGVVIRGTWTWAGSLWGGGGGGPEESAFDVVWSWFGVGLRAWLELLSVKLRGKVEGDETVYSLFKRKKALYPWEKQRNDTLSKRGLYSG